MAPQNKQPLPSGSPPEDGHLAPGAPSASSGQDRPISTVHERIRATGTALSGSLSAVIGALTETPRRPNALARELGVNRAVASRVLAAIGKHDPMEVLHVVPGPEPLRKLVRAAGRKGVPGTLTAAAESAITAFDQLIRDDAGTRAALDALISSSLPGARERFELSSRYAVYKGLSQLKGVQAEHWLGTAVVAPSADDELKHDLTWLNGAVALQRLRPGAAVRFAYRYRNSEGDCESDDEESPLSVVPLDEFCLHPPARLQTERAGNALHYTLPEDLLGPRQVVDMFVVDHHPAAMRRAPVDGPRQQTSLFIEPAIPVASLTFDVLLHEDVFADWRPELIVFDTGYDGFANVNDPSRDIDRIAVHEPIEVMGSAGDRLHLTEVPSYLPMLRHLGERFDWDLSRFRCYRTRIRYPVHGWQVCMAFSPRSSR